MGIVSAIRKIQIADLRFRFRPFEICSLTSERQACVTPRLPFINTVSPAFSRGTNIRGQKPKTFNCSIPEKLLWELTDELKSSCWL
jgi:hypothetical protein